MITLVLPYPISANRYWRPVNMGKHITIVPTKEAKAFKADIVRRARIAGITKPIDGRVRVEIDLYPQRPQDWAKRARANPTGWDDDVRCIDLDNATKVLFDALKGAAFGDDKFVFEYSAKRCEPDGVARCVVRIEKLHVEQMQQVLIDLPKISPKVISCDGPVPF